MKAGGKANRGKASAPTYGTLQDGSFSFASARELDDIRNVARRVRARLSVVQPRSTGLCPTLFALKSLRLLRSQGAAQIRAGHFFVVLVDELWGFAWVLMAGVGGWEVARGMDMIASLLVMILHGGRRNVGI